MRSFSGVGRVAALGAVIAAVALVAIVLFGGGTGGYQVKARFINAGQLVKGNPVQIGGVPVGSVKGIRITDDGQAEITMKIDDAHSPLHQGTHATIRQLSQSGIANRYVELTPPSGSKEIRDGGMISADKTTTAVDLDELFDTLDPKTRKALQGFFKGQARQFRGRGEEANVGLRYLNPALSTSSRLFHELTRDTPRLERFLIESSKFVTALAERRDDLAGLISNLDDTTRALGDQKLALFQAIENLPPFMRQADTTFVNLRAALDDLDPLVNASKPVARRLGPFLNQARAFAHDAGPTVRDLSLTIQRRGRSNDVLDLLRTVPPLYDIALVTRQRSVAPGRRRISVGRVRGAFPETIDALRGGTPQIAFSRPYTTDLLGWFDDFSTTGAGFDALGGVARAHTNLSESLPPNPGQPVKQGQFQRCPGAAEAPASDGSNVWSSQEQAQLHCKESARATGNVR